MHLSIDVLAPGYPGMAGAFYTLSRDLHPFLPGCRVCTAICKRIATPIKIAGTLVQGFKKLAAVPFSEIHNYALTLLP